MRRAEEADHLRSGWRQLDPTGRRELVERMLENALLRLDFLALRSDFEDVLGLCLSVRADPDPVRAASARVARWCVQWLEVEPTDYVFGEIAAAHAMTDPVHKLRGGRARGAVGPKMVYAQSLVERPGKRLDYKALHNIALSEADQAGSPFGKEDGELWDKERDCSYSLRDFQKLISGARNPKKR
jgi:hypothetical protein